LLKHFVKQNPRTSMNRVSIATSTPKPSQTSAPKAKASCAKAAKNAGGGRTLSPDLRLGLTSEMVNQKAFDAAVQRFAERKIALPTFAQVADPTLAPKGSLASLTGVDPDAADNRNLWRVNWFNGADRKSRVDVPVHVVLPPSLTGVEATIVVMLGNKFPMIRAHKVQAAYAVLAPRLVTGQFDPVSQRAIWPSTGNYARGGVAISRLMACRGTAVLPEGMSKERFEWLAQWTEDPSDVVRTFGTESNVKEIYDKCNELSKDPQNVILNQFSEFANYLGHFHVTGRALSTVFEHVAAQMPSTAHPRLRWFTSATGSAGTIGAGDYLKEKYGTHIAALEALECPTMLKNGFGEHNIQGIGDKHIPLIHNVMNTDAVIAVSDRATDNLDILFNTAAGMAHLRDRLGVPGAVIEQLTHFGYSAICNTIGAIKLAKEFRMTADDVIVTVATDGSELYPSEREKFLARDYASGFGAVDAAEVTGRYLQSVDRDNMIQLTELDRERIFNLGYYTWVEQQGTSFDDFVARKEQSWWKSLRDLVPVWDERIVEFNQRTGMAS
jgi:cysteine synthase